MSIINKEQIVITETEKIKRAVHSKIMVSCAAQICAYGELPRFEGKAQRIFDNRS